MKARESLLVLVLCLCGGVLSAQGLIDLRPHPQPERHVRPPALRPITIARHQVEVTIEGGAARTKVVQVFHNDNRAQLEGRYVFPIPEAASITEFTMVMNGKVVKGEVLEKDKARAIYEDIVRRLRDPALLEYMGRDLFQARVFPIPAGGDVEISLSYVEELAADGGVFEYRYPLKTQAFSTMPVADLVISAVVRSPRELKSVFSSSHKVAVNRRSDQEVSVSFEGKRELADRDFHLLFTEAGKGIGLHVLSEKNAREGGFFMLKLSPPLEYEPADILPRDIVFVLDTSGSMQEDDKIAQARDALIHGLRTLREGDRFNIVTFATDSRGYAKGLVEATKVEVAQAVAWVKEIEAAGGTNIDEALGKAAASFGDGTRLRMIVFLTDGRPTIGVTDEKTILAHAAERLPAGARLFVFGVGFDVNARLLDTLAEKGRGARDYVTPGQNLELALSTFFDKVAHPVLSDLKITAEGIELFESYPKLLPDLFKGGEITVFGRYRGEGHHALRLAGKVGDRDREYVFEGSFVGEKAGRDFIPVLWAKRKVGYLFDEIRLKGEDRELVAEIVRLGKTFGIATPYTSFLVTEDESMPEATSRRRRSGDDPVDRHGPPPPASPQGRGDTAPGGWAPVGGGAGGEQGSDGFGERDAERKRGVHHVGRETNGRSGVISSLEAKKLKDSGELSDEDRKGSRVARRLKGRSFRQGDQGWIELDAAGKEIDGAKAESIEAFSPRYFELVAAHEELAAILAELPDCVLLIDGKVYRFKAAPPAEAPDPAPESAPTR
ncbi:MAG: VWA domain-containing protein [Planctomycetes bacterium]|nr:VWA domain-containing protein [Planctomycetota bacterium]